ncbi:hydroperoxide isomerase ALOXE3-like [Anolis sagrei]|uniref:hydroperoxide isomerase ALOXE3-like n=1 Tax=Anolis sagrei TaxID=38937 RepID=UPI00352114F0
MTVKYKVRVTTGNHIDAGTLDSIFITLVGTEGESPKTVLDNWGVDFYPGAVSDYEVSCKHDLGDIILLRFHKEYQLKLFTTDWYCTFITVTSPKKVVYKFPCYQWMEGCQTLELREGTAKTPAMDILPLLKDSRIKELQKKQSDYGWKIYADGVVHCLNVSSMSELQNEDQFSFTKGVLFAKRAVSKNLELKLRGLSDNHESWEDLEDIKKTLWVDISDLSKYITEHWKDDAFFGYQFLNGLNPRMIQRCTKIPPNFPVTNAMVAKSIGDDTTLEKELEKGNIFIADYKLLEGLPTKLINGRQQYIAVPLCLMHLSKQKHLMPLAIQLSQTPGPESPIFLPSDPEWDWILAKTWVRNSDFYAHQIVAHLLRTHLLAEVFALAVIRQLPMCHPLYKLLIPHMRYTFHINVVARDKLISKGGILDEYIGIGYEGLVELLRKGTKALTFSSLCLPEDLEARGVSSLPHYYYKEDGMKLWEAVERFVSGIIDLYYPTDRSVQEDCELQKWMAEVFEKGFLAQESSGLSSSFSSVKELKKFMTAVIFTCSCQHSAVNTGQFEFGFWMPNLPFSMRRPPPTTKGTANLEDYKDTIPDISTTCKGQSVLWTISNPSGDVVPLGNYPEEHFTEESPRRLIAAFQEELKKISKEIEQRNKSVAKMGGPVPLGYKYLYPPEIENSVTV